MRAASAEEQEQTHLTQRSLVRLRPSTGQVTNSSHSKSERKVVRPAVQRASRGHGTTDSLPEIEYATTEDIIPTTKSKPSVRKARQRTHPLFYIGCGMVATLLLTMGLSLALGWGQTALDDLRYGRPRTFQIDAMVGHNEQNGQPSHFIAINLNRRIQIIEISGGDAAHTHIYTGPQLYGPNDDLAPVTLRFLDVNGDHRPDMLVTFQGSRIAYINEKDAFRPALPAEQSQIERALRNS
ncbi:hypothetical protein [Ktedonospora formicarum]|uniref:VCBS repeat-containing protein n=1 Tax=Ktedonospora formicarum TaxID=2778364 RepID=A0A8J3ICJ2_9CHLR|nr:hypothetical protein [Ktedonospora formicarum]GHO49609.1 hypothetical protein KSX_77720 [Ktedonospora formicarum]